MAVSIYLNEQKLKSCHVLALGVLEITTILREIRTIKFSRMERFCSMEVELTWMGL